MPKEMNRCYFLVWGPAKGAWKLDVLFLEEAPFPALDLSGKSELTPGKITQEPFQ